MSIKINSLSEKEVKDRKWDVEYIKKLVLGRAYKSLGYSGNRRSKALHPQKDKDCEMADYDCRQSYYCSCTGRDYDGRIMREGSR